MTTLKDLTRDLVNDVLKVTDDLSLDDLPQDDVTEVEELIDDYIESIKGRLIG